MVDKLQGSVVDVKVEAASRDLLWSQKERIQRFRDLEGVDATANMLNARASIKE